MPYIYDQKDESIGSKPFGMSNVAHAGCGAVATYNALITLGAYTSFDDVLGYFNKDSSQLSVFGWAGSSTSLIAKYFRDHGYTVRMTDNIDEMDVYSRTADASILWYAFPATYSFAFISVDAFGAHFVEVGQYSYGFVGRNTAEGNGLHTFAWLSDYAYKGDRCYAIGIFIYKNGGAV